MSDYFPLMGKIAQDDVRIVQEKDKEYGSSWMKRGGVGAYMMLARKWDRLEEFVSKRHGWDIFKAIATDQRDEGVLDDIRDLRQYLLLVETEMITRLKRPINAAENAKGANDGPAITDPAMTDQEVRDILGRQTPAPHPGEYTDAETRRMKREAAQGFLGVPVGAPIPPGGPVSTPAPVGPSTGLTDGRGGYVSRGSFPTGPGTVPGVMLSGGRRGGFGPRGFDPAQDA